MEMPGFWDWRGNGKSGAAALATEPALELEPVELYTANAMIFGQIDPQGQRLSDILNSNTRLSIRHARSTSMLPDVPGAAGQGWDAVATEDILLAMPPEQVSPRQLRVNRRQHRVRITTGPYVVVGNAHVPPGVGVDAYALQRRIKFLAVTKAVIYSTSDTAFERFADVVLVNVGPVAELTEVLTIS
jgi:hypothetical protein